MSNELKSLGTIFEKRIYRIPDYQRGYAWGVNQLEDFWEDIVNLPQGKNHYTGMLSLETVPKKEIETWSDEKWIFDMGDFQAFYVVDGQQRLTTFVIFIQAFVDYILALPENKNEDRRNIIIKNDTIEDIISRYLYTTNKRYTTLTAYKFGYCDDPSYNYLKKEILHREIAGSVEETFYTYNLSKAKEFFDKNISEYYLKNGIQALEQLYAKATSSMKFMIHEIDEEFDVYAAFETMNNRGKKLSNLELLKSRLIYLTTLYTDNRVREDERETLRKNINDAWKEVYKWLGKNKNAPLSDNEFLRAHWILKYQFSSKRGNDYASFLLNKEFTIENVIETHAVSVERYFDDEKEDNIIIYDVAEDLEENQDEEISDGKRLTPEVITEYVISLSGMAKHWFYSFYPETSDYSDEEKLWIDKLNRIGIAYFRPLVVASFMREDVDPVTRIELLREIERFIFIAFRLNGAYANYHQNEVNKLVRKLYSKEIEINDVTDNIHRRIESWVHAATEFDTKPFLSRIQRLYSDGTGFYYWGPLRYVLYEYEIYLKDNAKDMNMLVSWEVKRDKSNDISIEHIYPQNPNEKSSWIEVFAGYNDEKRSILRGSLGNLLLLSVAKNAQLQNDEYQDKVNGRKNENGEEIYKGYCRGSHSETDVAKNYTTWDANAILKRGLEIMRFIGKRWDIHFSDENSMIEILGLDFVEQAE